VNAYKRIKGRNRHIVVDTMGLLMQVVVHPADLQDKSAALLVLSRLQGRFTRLRKIWADRGYVSGTLRTWVADRLAADFEWVEPQPTVTLQHSMPHRWVVERTFAWLGRHRRLSKDYEALPNVSENLIYAAMTALMLRRLAR
jgi:putative transposase